MRFLDRADAGRFLAEQLGRFANRGDVIVLALPRGGVPVGYEVARALHAPLEVFVVRKLGVPGQRELAMGAIASGGTRVLNPDVLAALGEDARQAIEETTAREMEELALAEKQYRAAREFPDLHGKTIILVDDGLATGATMRAAARAVRQLQPRSVVVAVPVAAESSCRELRREADAVICGFMPAEFFGVGQFYDNFRQTTDEEVRELLRQAAENTSKDSPNEPAASS
jgi:predicted phosphoribosyltransferase